MILAASYTIGSYVLPGRPIENIAKEFNSKVKLKVATCSDIVDGIRDKKYDLGLIETPVFDDSLIYREWMRDELVICSKVKIGDRLTKDDLARCRLVARAKNSLARKVISKFLNSVGIFYDNFISISEMNNETAVINSVKWSRPNRENPTVAIVSLLAIEDEIKRGELHISRIEESPIVRSFYLVYDGSLYSDKKIDRIIETLKDYKHYH